MLQDTYLHALHFSVVSVKSFTNKPVCSYQKYSSLLPSCFEKWKEAPSKLCLAILFDINIYNCTEEPWLFLKLNPLNSWSALNLMKDRLQGPTNFLWMPVSLDFERVICSAFDEPVRTPEVSALKVLLLIWKYKDWQHSKGCKRMVKQQHSYWWPRLLCT